MIAGGSYIDTQGYILVLPVPSDEVFLHVKRIEEIIFWDELDTEGYMYWLYNQARGG